MISLVSRLSDRLVGLLVPRVRAAASGDDCWIELDCRADITYYCALLGGNTLSSRQCCVDASGTFCSSWVREGCC